MPELAPGQVIAENFKLESLLGEGGMGAVWKATDLKLGRVVALKVLHTDLRADPSLMERFQREARLLASVEHPGIVPVFAMETIVFPDGKSCPCIVMPFVKGRALSDLLRQGGPMPLPEAVPLLVSLLEACSRPCRSPTRPGSSTGTSSPRT
jgi:serine/threonine-protein kinase